MGLIIRVKGFDFNHWVDEIEGNEVLKFLDASELDYSYKSSLETLVTSLKGAGLWSKITALYPFVGSTFEQMSYNLKDPDVAKLTLVNNTIVDVTKDVSWIRQSGGYISTNFGFPASQINDYHMLVSTDVNYNSASLCVPIGIGAISDGSCIILINGKEIQFRNNINNGIKTTSQNLPTSGGLIIASNKGISVNGVKSTIADLPNGNMNNSFNGKPICLGGYNSSGGFNPIEGFPTWNYKIAGFGYDLTDDEIQTYSQILNEFKSLY